MRCLTSHGLRAVDKNILPAPAEETSPPQVEVVNVTPLIGGQLQGQTSSEALVGKKTKKTPKGCATHLGAVSHDNNGLFVNL